MNQMAFVAAAYVVGVGATAVLVGWAWLSMRRAERALHRLRNRGD